MKLSELIATLASAKGDRGDVNVNCYTGKVKTVFAVPAIKDGQIDELGEGHVFLVGFHAAKV